MKEVLKDQVFDDMTKHRVSAFDGLDPKFVNYLQKNVENVNFNRTTPKEYACLLSHIKAIQEFVKSGDEIAIIFEDDISMEFKKYWKTTLEECICKAPKDWEIIQLYYNNTKYNNNPKLLNKLYTEHTENSEYYGAVAYVINKKGATRFLKKLIKNNKIILEKDTNNSYFRHVSDIYLYLQMKTYVYKYPFFTYVSKDTTIQSPKDVGYQKKIKKNMTKLLKNS
jgi:GR25 family glycosyltransferase involved in LPS biosynthesis